MKIEAQFKWKAIYRVYKIQKVYYVDKVCKGRKVYKV